MKKVLLMLLAFFSVMLSTEAQRLIKGNVTDKSGDPVIGANVLAKGTAVGTITDLNGNYTLTVPEGVNTIVVSYTGYTSQDIVLGSSNMVDVSLQEGVLLQETVISALGVSRNKSAVPYADQTVNNEELNTVTNKSVLNALQGKTAGVKINQGSGQTGSSTRIVLRGETSLTQGNNALIVVDGVPINNNSSSGGGGTGKLGDRDNYVDFGNRGNDLNPDDVASVTVLKGPSATTLYGSRGASGVILITTKKGRSNAESKPTISFSSSLSSESVYLVMKQQDKFGSGYASCGGCGGGIDIFMGENFAWGAPLDGRILPWTGQPADSHGDLIPLNNGKYEQLTRPYSAVKNNLRDFFDIGTTRRNNISVGGGNDKYNYFVSYTNFDNKGIIPHTTFKKHNILLNVGSNFSKKFNTSFSFNYSKINQRGATEGGYPFGYASGTPAYSFALQTPPNIPFHELRDYNSPYQDFKGFYGQYSVNPYYILDKQVVRNNVDNVVSSINLNYMPIEHLTLSGQASTNFSISGVTENNPKFFYERTLSWSDGVLSDFNSPRNSTSLGGYKELTDRRTDLVFDLKARYDAKINNDFTFTPTIGFNSIQEQFRQVAGQTVGGLVIPEFYDLSNSVENPLARNESYLYRLFGVYANASLGFKNFLFAEYSARNDWSSTLPKNKRDFFYQGGGLSFVPTNLDNFDVNPISFLKLRASIGTAGKDAPRYRLNSNYVLNPLILDYGDDYQVRFPFNGNPGASKSTIIGNPDLKPELSVTSEIGIDLGLLKDRINIEYTYYNIDSKNQIVDVNIPWSSGYRIAPTNIGRMENKGHELGLRITAIHNNLIEWKVFGTWSKNKNTVKTILENDSDKDELNIFTSLVHFAGHGSLNLVAAEGQAFGTFKGTGYVHDSLGRIVVDGTGNPIQSSTLSYLGSYQPNFLATFGTEFSIKGFTLHALFDMRDGGLFYSGSKVSSQFNGTASTTLLKDRKAFILENSVDAEGKENKLETNAYSYFRGAPASSFLVDASYLKFREMAISYTLPKKSLGRVGVSDVTISIYGKNLKFWLPAENTFADPEVGGVGGASDAVGIETTTTPSQRSFGAELRLKF
ncbi:MAG: SusC/RagA family TonB-linked outer membrane protein [Saprospiraceae bacterium]|nr:SusC/RagA family TonB-linked outer membrane protein [Candidatus Defluviibacterium haderslevense]